MSLVIGDRRLRLRPYLRHYPAAESGVFLVSDRESWLLRGAVYRELIPLLTGASTESGISELLATGHNPAELYRALEELRREGHVEDQQDELPLDQASFWQACGVNSGVAEARLKSTPVKVVTLGGLEPEAASSMLRESNVCLDRASQHWLVLTPDYLRPELEAVADQAQREGAQWLLAKPVGLEIWTGPVFGPDCCWACLAHRLRGHRKVETYLSRNHGWIAASSAEVPHLPATLQLGVAVAATQFLNWIAEPETFSFRQSIGAMNVQTLERTTHVVTRRPQCQSCGNPGAVSSQQWKPLRLASRPQPINDGAGCRVESLELTEQRLSRQISPITGLVGAVRSNIPTSVASSLLHSYAVESISGGRDFWASTARRARSAGGKGATPIQARVSALSEAIERHSGEFQADEARVSSSFRDLGDTAIHPNAVMLISERQYAERHQLNCLHPNAPEQIPEPFEEDTEIDWSPVWPLSGGPARYLPTALCFYDAGGEGSRFTIADSNGCAAGNCKEEAILQGLLELVERDAVAIWWYNQVSRAAVNLASFGRSYFDELQDYYRAIQRELWVLDITTDFEIPTFAAVSRHVGQKTEDILLGFGAHLSAEIAIQRALTEVNQSLPAVLNVKEGSTKEYSGNSAVAIQWWQNATLQTEPYLIPDSSPSKTGENYPAPHFADLKDAVNDCVARVEARGFDVFALDQTRPDTGLDVVRVVAPGLRHFRRRFASGRLYSVPLALNWISRAPEEHEFNRYSPYF